MPYIACIDFCMQERVHWVVVRQACVQFVQVSACALSRMQCDVYCLACVCMEQVGQLPNTV